MTSCLFISLSSSSSSPPTSLISPSSTVALFLNAITRPNQALSPSNPYRTYRKPLPSPCGHRSVLPKKRAVKQGRYQETGPTFPKRTISDSPMLTAESVRPFLDPSCGYHRPRKRPTMKLNSLLFLAALIGPSDACKCQKGVAWTVLCCREARGRYSNGDCAASSIGERLSAFSACCIQMKTVSDCDCPLGCAQYVTRRPRREPFGPFGGAI